ncbi:MAG TPA: alkaline phosphatase family protein, partial [Myxococcota bacterium]|nr:alkaline phosphatase family protein [Myxococcota bacterium]
MWSALPPLVLLCFSAVLYWLAPIFPQNPMPMDLLIPAGWCVAYTLLASPVLALVARLVKARGRWLWLAALPAFAYAGYSFGADRLPQKKASHGKTTPALCKLQFLGMDGLDHAQLQAMGAELPNFQRLYSEAAWGSLKTVSRHSPEIWTSVVTGMKPKDHGVSGYTTSWLTGTALELPDDSRDWLGQFVYANTNLRTRGAVGSNARRVRALWELAGDYERSSVFVNWW